MNLIAIDKATKKERYMMSSLHSHSHYEIYILTEGERDVFFYNASYTFHAPACIIIPPFIMHKTEGFAYERFNINVYPQYLNETEKELLFKYALNPLTFSKRDGETILRLLDLFLELHEHDDELSKYMIRSLFDCILTFISKNCTVSSNKPNSAKLPVILLKTLKFFQEHYAEKITLDSLEEKFFVSKKTIIYNFKKYLNESPIDYLLKIRLMKAKKLLLAQQKLSIEKIANACGFSCANYFTECFKDKEGLSPTAFRKLIFQEK